MQCEQAVSKAGSQKVHQGDMYGLFHSDAMWHTSSDRQNRIEYSAGVNRCAVLHGMSRVHGDFCNICKSCEEELHGPQRRWSLGEQCSRVTFMTEDTLANESYTSMMHEY